MIRSLGIFSTLLLIIFFFVYRKSNKEKKLWVIFIYTCVSLLVDISFDLMRRNRKIELGVFSLFTPLEYVFFSLFFYYTFSRDAFKKIILGCSVLFCAIFLYNIFYFKSENFDSLPASAEAIFVVIFSVLYFYEQINDPNITFIYGTKNFWIIVAFLLYLSVNLFPFIARTFVTSQEVDVILAPINSVANILKNVFFAVAFSLQPKANKAYIHEKHAN